LLRNRETIFSAAMPARQDRILVPNANDGLLLWESLRRCPEGLSAALVGSEAMREALLRYAAVLDKCEQPEIAVIEGEDMPSPEQTGEWFSSPQFDRILMREPFRKGFTGEPKDAFSRLAASALSLLAPGGNLILLCSPPVLGGKISRLMVDECGGAEDVAAKIGAAEEEFFSQAAAWNWSGDTLAAAFSSAGFTVQTETLDQSEERLIGAKDIDAWFDKENSRWGSFMFKTLGAEIFLQAEETLRRRIQEGPLVWKWKSLLLKAAG
jgi:putative ATPase